MRAGISGRHPATAARAPREGGSPGPVRRHPPGGASRAAVAHRLGRGLWDKRSAFPRNAMPRMRGRRIGRARCPYWCEMAPLPVLWGSVDSRRCWPDTGTRPPMRLQPLCFALLCIAASPAAAQDAGDPPSAGRLRDLSAAVEGLAATVAPSVVQVLVTGYRPV